MGYRQNQAISQECEMAGRRRDVVIAKAARRLLRRWLEPGRIAEDAIAAR